MRGTEADAVHSSWDTVALFNLSAPEETGEVPEPPQGLGDRVGDLILMVVLTTQCEYIGCDDPAFGLMKAENVPGLSQYRTHNIAFCEEHIPMNCRCAICGATYQAHLGSLRGYESCTEEFVPKPTW